MYPRSRFRIRYRLGFVSRFIFVFVICAFCGVLVLPGQTKEAPPINPISQIQNDKIRVGVDLRRGGSIGYLADVKIGKNQVNTHDLGRWIGQSYYSGPKPFGKAHPAWKDWPWNPVSAGDVFGNSSKILEHKNDGNLIYVRSQPMQWALNATPAECQFETWITLENRMVHVKNRLTNQRQDKTQYPAMDQELPAIYTNANLHILKTYSGNQPFTNAPLVEIPKRPALGPNAQWSTFSATEHWAALLDENDWGLGIIHPGAIRFLGGFYHPKGKANANDSTGYISPIRKEILDYNIVFTYHYTLVLDSLPNIRRVAMDMKPKSSHPDYRFQSDRQHWWFQNGTDHGNPIQGSLRLDLNHSDPQMIGPETDWPANEVPKLFIQAAYKSKNRTAELFWDTDNSMGFQPGNSLRFEIIPDQKFHTYELDLSKAPGYKGRIRQLRLDPIESGGPGEYVQIESISAIRK